MHAIQLKLDCTYVDCCPKSRDLQLRTLSICTLTLILQVYTSLVLAPVELRPCRVQQPSAYDLCFPDNPGTTFLQQEVGEWVAKERLREKMLPRINDRPLVEFVLSVAPNKVTDRGVVFRQAPPPH